MSIQKENISQFLKREIVKTFIQTLVDLQSPKEMETFINDFLTEKELDTLSKRLAISYWLKKNRSAKNIKDNLKVTAEEIAEVIKQMNKDGYKLAIKKMEAEEWANVWTERIQKFTKAGKK